jgi:hypothetical protein
MIAALHLLSKGNQMMIKRNHDRDHILIRALLLCVAFTLCTFTRVATAEAVGEIPAEWLDAAAVHEDQDAVILNWQQHWTVDRDGAITRRDHRWVLISNRRAIGRYADQRIDFDADTDTLTIHTARTHLPGGAILPVPDYGFNIGAPSDLSGWPAWSSWRQRIVSFSGIVAGCVLELDYEVTTKPGALPCAWDHVKLTASDPILERSVALTTPMGQPQRAAFHSIDPAPLARQTRRGDVLKSIWTIRRLPADPQEPQLGDWCEWAPGFMFTTGPARPDLWSEIILRIIRDAASSSDDAITEFAHDAIADTNDAAARARAVASALRQSMHVVSTHEAMRDLACAEADFVFERSYGHPLEMVALLHAALRAADLDVTLHHAPPAHGATSVPTPEWLDGIVLAVHTDAEPLLFDGHAHEIRPYDNWDREHGRFAPPLPSGPRFAAWHDMPNELVIEGDVTIKGQAASADLTIVISGLFTQGDRLDEADDQRRRLGAVAGRVLPGFTLDEAHVRSLAPGRLEARITMTRDTLDHIADDRVLWLGDDPAFLADVPLPLGRSYRKSRVRLVDGFAARTTLDIHLPEGTTPAIAPRPVEGGQRVTVSDGRIRIERSFEQRQRWLSPDEFADLRAAVRGLQSDGMRMIHLSE